MTGGPASFYCSQGAQKINHLARKYLDSGDWLLTVFADDFSDSEWWIEGRQSDDASSSARRLGVMRQG
jgi:hypothetical protein